MPKTREQKQEVIKSINQKIKDSKSLIISVFDKLKVNQDQELRQKLRQNGIKYEVVKKTLLKRSFEENGVKDLPEDELLGNISITASKDEVTGAKILAEFAGDKEDFKIIGGLLNNIWVDADKILELAKLPSKDELLTRAIGAIKAPLSGFVNVLSGDIKGLINILNAIKNNK